MLKHAGKTSLVSLSLMTVLGCTSITWIATTALKPSIVLAQPLEINLPLQRQGEENYQSFILRGESLAQGTISEYFKRYPHVEAIKLVIVGENQGAIAPVLSLRVTRQDWSLEPQVRRWGSYFQDSKFLLGFEQPSTPSKPSPVTVEKPKTPETPPQTASEPQDKPKNPPETPPIPVPEPEPEQTPPTPTDRVRDAGRNPPPPDSGN